jgi:uncharacterized glyoxalase superfamily protein PhnB
MREGVDRRSRLAPVACGTVARLGPLPFVPSVSALNVGRDARIHVGWRRRIVWPQGLGRCGVRSARIEEVADGRTFRVGLRVDDVPAAVRFCGGLGFEQVGIVPSPDSEPVLGISARGDANLLVDALVGLPFPDSERERQIERGPGGLVVIGLDVDDLDVAYPYCTDAGCTITCEPMDEAWGELVFTCVDPFG